VLGWSVSGIPIFSIVIRYNLLENGICNVFWGNIWAVVFPWVVALVFYAGSSMNNLMNYVSLISTIPLNLIGETCFRAAGLSLHLNVCVPEQPHCAFVAICSAVLPLYPRS
jgi:hypothetical protein